MNKTGFVIVYNDAGQAGLQDENGQLVVPCQYDKILDYDDDGYIRVLKGDVYGTLNWNCQEVIPHSIGLTHLGSVVILGGLTFVNFPLCIHLC